MNIQTQLSDFAIPEEIMVKVRKRQKSITTQYDLSRYNYMKVRIKKTGLIEFRSRESVKEYYASHRKEILVKSKSRNQNHKEEISEYLKEYYQNHKEEIKARSKKCYTENKVQRKKYCSANKEKICEYRNKNRCKNNKASHERYLKNPERKRAYNKKYYEKNKKKINEQTKKYSDNHKKEYREYANRYRKTENGKRSAHKSRAHRRNLGHEVIATFKPFSILSPTHFHHVTQDFVIEIPVWIHLKSYAGIYIRKHRNIALHMIQPILNSEYYDILIPSEFDKLRL